MSATLIQLVSGELVTSDAEEWRAECLARYILDLPTLPERRAFLAKWEERHGRSETQALKDRMQAIHEARGGHR
jgi:hypothetical protein